MGSVVGSQHCLLKIITEVGGKEQAIVFLFEGDTKETDRGAIPVSLVPYVALI